MKKLFALLLAMILVLSLAACGGKDDEKSAASSAKPASSSQKQEDKTPEADELKDKGGEEAQPSEEQRGNETGEKSWDELDLPDGFPRLADTVSSFNITSSGRYSFTWENTDFDTSEAKVNMMREWANGTITGSTVGQNTTWQIQNARINLIAAYSDSDKFMMLETSVTEGASLSSYLAAHTLAEDDFKPANFKGFSELTTSGSNIGGITQTGAFEVYIEDGTYKQEDAVAWCDTIIKRIAEVSAANDNVITDLRNNVITTYDEYAEKDGGVPEHPSIGCYFASDLGGSKYVIQITAGYYNEGNVYRVQLQTMRRL